MKKNWKMKWIGLAACVLSGLLAVSCNKDIYSEDDWVDLGLPSGLLWATRNVGATSPEDYGDFFAWGETTPKSVYNWSTYIYCKRDEEQLTKYCSLPIYGYNGFTDNLTTLQRVDDAATAHYGGRTPTIEEWHELLDNTKHGPSTQNGVTGHLFKGTNGNKLFLPAAGYRRDSSHDFYGSRGHYWSSTLTKSEPSLACGFNFKSTYRYHEFFSLFRCKGYPVRAVRQK